MQGLSLFEIMVEGECYVGIIIIIEAFMPGAHPVPYDGDDGGDDGLNRG